MQVDGVFSSYDFIGNIFLSAFSFFSHLANLFVIFLYRKLQFGGENLNYNLFSLHPDLVPVGEFPDPYD